jgi:hypothetical protein
VIALALEVAAVASDTGHGASNAMNR